MRLRNACAIGAMLALCALSGCNKSNGIRNVAPPAPHFKSDANTPHVAAQNEIALAQEYIRQGQYEVALASLQKAVKLDPSSPDGYTMLGLLNERINRLDQAEAAYAKSVKLAPNKGDILNNYGAWLCRSGHPVEADSYFHKALGDPFYKTPAVALGNAATCASKAGKPELAESYYRQVLALDPNNADALQTLAGIMYGRGDYMRARGFVERLLASGKPAPETLDLAARIEDKLGNQEGARGYRDRLATEFPQYTPGQH